MPDSTKSDGFGNSPASTACLDAAAGSPAHLTFDVQVVSHPYGWIELVTREDGTRDEQETMMTAQMVLVKARIDGLEPIVSHPDRPFDALAAIALGAQDGERALYTCSCGIAECAGIHEGIRIGHVPTEQGAARQGRVFWAFPMRSYARHFAQEFAARHGLPRLPSQADEPVRSQEPELAGELVVAFDAKQYQRAIDGLLQQLQQLAREIPELVVAPFDGSNPPARCGFSVVWPRIQAWMEKSRDDSPVTPRD